MFVMLREGCWPRGLKNVDPAEIKACYPSGSATFGGSVHGVGSPRYGCHNPPARASTTSVMIEGYQIQDQKKIANYRLGQKGLTMTMMTITTKSTVGTSLRIRK